VSVYVDRAANGFGRMIMCHMIADTPAELRAMAVRIGVAVKWFQAESSMPHFDICKSKRQLALAAGALELDRRAFVEAMGRIRPTWPRADGLWLLE
jgi:hypothetical protein